MIEHRSYVWLTALMLAGCGTDGGDSTGEPGTGSTGSTGGTDGAGVDDGGCGCTTSGAPSTTALWLGLVGLGLRRRRRAA